MSRAQVAGYSSISKGNNEWYTPKESILRVIRVLDHIDTDPASNDEAQQIINAGTYYTKEDSGLDHHWFGRVFMNPPYSKDLLKPFLEHFLSEWAFKHITEGILLLNNGTDTRWFNRLLEQSGIVCFPTGRLKFYTLGGKQQQTHTQGQVFFYFGNNKDRFREVFSEIGNVMVKL